MEHTEKELDTLPKKDGFRLRGIENTRLQTFMDAAFAFAMTMLVISVGEIPEDYQELIISLKEIPAFLCSFFVIMLFWLNHRSWSRRYGLEDSVTIFLSISLIFVLLVYIYPLRLMFSSLFAWISGGWIPSRFELQTRSELIGLFVIYGSGLFTMSGIITLLYVRAKILKKKLFLNVLEVHKTSIEITSLSVVSITGLLSAILAWALPERIALVSGFLYATIPLTMIFVGLYFSRKEKKIISSSEQKK